MMGAIVRLLYLFSGAIATAALDHGSKKQPPHVLFVLVDDLGWGDVGFHYDDKSTKPREVQTPTIDRLAEQEGMALHRHYVHKSCTGTRTSLQSGRFPVHVTTALKNPEVPSSGMPRNLTGLAEHMKVNDRYSTHYVGKWDVGMATPKHTPKGRGYDTSLNYFEHKNDFWTQECMQSKCCAYHMQEELEWKQDENPGMGSQEAAAAGDKLKIRDLWDTDRPARSLAGTDYEEFIFQRRMFDIIDQYANKTQHVDNPHDPQQSLFLFYAPHVAHCPLQVPQSYLDQFAFMDEEGTDEAMCQAQTSYIVDKSQPQPKYSCRKQYHAMVKLMDDIIGRLVDRLKQHNMWDDTVVVFTSDNGGPVGPDESAATNYPLRGGKYSDWEGGVRAAAFVSGGYLPKHRRGAVVEEPIHICDWYATLPALGGVDVHEELEKLQEKEQKGKVPPVDAVNVWSVIMGERDAESGKPPPRNEIPVSENTLIVGDYKLIWSPKVPYAGWTYLDYPNANTKPGEIKSRTLDCSQGCLFNVATDPGEHRNVASAQPKRVEAMKKRLHDLRQGFYENDDRGIDSCPHNTNSMPCACWMAVNHYGGFFGPYQEVDIYAKDLLVGEAAVQE